MSQLAEPEERRDAFRDAVRQEVITFYRRHWSLFHEPVDIEKASGLIMAQIAEKNQWKRDGYGKPIPPSWPFYPTLPKLLGIRRRTNEAASEVFYMKNYHERPPLLRLGRKDGKMLYQPRLDE